MDNDPFYNKKQDETEDDWIWIIVGIVGVIVILLGLGALVCFFWQRRSNNFRAVLLGIPFLSRFLQVRRDSLDDLNEMQQASHAQNVRQWRRGRGEVVGVKGENAIMGQTATTGYRWKKKWRDRKAKSKEKRKEKHQERKKRRAERAAQSSKKDDISVSSDASSSDADSR